MKRKIIQLLVFLGLGVFFIWFSVKDFKPEDVDIIKNSLLGVLNPKSMLLIFLSMVSGMLAHFFRALRNILLIDPLGYRVRIATAFYSVMTCYLANLAIPRLGEVLRCTLLQRYDQIPFQKSFGTVVADRFFDLIVFAFLFILILFLNNELISNLGIKEQFALWFREKWLIIWEMKLHIACLLLLLTVGLALFIRGKKRIGNKQSKIAAFIKKIVLGLWQGIVSVKDLKYPYLFVVYTIAIWIFYYLGTYLCMSAFDFLQHLSPMPAFIVLVVGAIGFMIAQGGLGAYPLFVAGILLLYNIDYAQGLAAGWIGWSAQTLMILIVGFSSLILTSLLKVENRALNNNK
jgi:uncharacterized protein (TIRG00374 family)